MLDEIINYVQSLQQQVEFLSMKLSTVIPDLCFDAGKPLLMNNNLQHAGATAPGLSNPELGSFLTLPISTNASQSLPLDSELHSLYHTGFALIQLIHPNLRDISRPSNEVQEK
ncbi:hypothetical protein MLD38_024705 [Melastoma candidum]|uniref:Uncharacterized protein n=1 Tax=Melastoma candidum TaxID=119954 RepID=A0ACB9NT46_9MYRT|nr:hypothetical protein MLD38_024705 [Melastoma candidum]